MKSRKTALAAVLLSAAVTLPLQAHHSFAEFDTTKTLTVICTVKEFQWVNPHSWLIVVAPNEQGIAQEYRFEGVPPAVLTRSGWTDDTLLVGDRITLDYHPLKDGTPGGAYVAVTLPNGKHLGTSGTSFVPFSPANTPPPAPRQPPPPTHPIIID
ncbi:MAG TPA: DUF6152 family protein [Steroidobacteraceae bacterium]|nr:DUF6152 family protein [Steroidobacteraceae bacterium]